MRRIAVLAAAVALAAPAAAEPIRNPIAVFSGLDKITGGITSFEVAIDQTHQFGTLFVRPRVCYSRPVTEEPKTTSFVEIDETTRAGKSGRVLSIPSMTCGSPAARIPMRHSRCRRLSRPNRPPIPTRFPRTTTRAPACAAAPPPARPPGRRRR